MENIEYANILKKSAERVYFLFDLMEKEIWNKAVQDSVGVKTFLKIINLHGVWEDRIEATIITGNSKGSKKLLIILKVVFQMTS